MSCNKLPISVIVCVKNRESYIGQCLNSISANHPSEIIVIDDGSTDSTREIAMSLGALVHSNRGTGVACARQLGADLCQMPYIAYVDSDITLPTNCLIHLLTELKIKGWHGIHAQVESPESRNYWEWAQDQHYRLTFNNPGRRSAIATMTAVFPTEVIRAVKFDTSITGASEDGDLSSRLLKAGYALGIASTAVCYHYHRADFQSFWQQRKWYGAGTVRLALKERSLGRAVGPFVMPIYGSALSIIRRKPLLVPYFWINMVGYIFGMVQEIARYCLHSRDPDTLACAKGRQGQEE